MRFHKFTAVLLTVSGLCSCGSSVPVPPPGESETSGGESVTMYIQEVGQLYPGETAETGAKSYTPLNYSNQIGIWYPYMDYGEYMQGKSADEFRAAVNERFSSAKNDGINTLYIHIRPNGEVYYDSKIFPKGTYLDGDYDPLQIMIEEAHSLGLSVHGWINPLRCQTKEQLEKTDSNFIIKQWAETEACDNVRLVGNRYYLNPASDEALQLVFDSVTEIVKNYEVDGIHIDDYFYPTTDESFDAARFAASGGTDLSAYRLERCSKMVHGIFEAVKRADDRLLFGISPQGNINADYSSQYADVRLWGSCIGYCDYLVPQIYFGFENSTCPFEKTLREWESLVSCENVSLVIGLAAYKQGAEDKWAGEAGELEWVRDSTVIQRQIELVTASDNAAGYALYY